MAACASCVLWFMVRGLPPAVPQVTSSLSFLKSTLQTHREGGHGYSFITPAPRLVITVLVPMLVPPVRLPAVSS